MSRPQAAVAPVGNKTSVICWNVIPNHEGTKIMKKSAETKQFEVKSAANFSAEAEVEGHFKMKLKSLAVAAALGAVLYSASLP